MKKLAYFITVGFVLVCMLHGCESQDDIYNKFRGNGPIIYIGTVDSVKVFSGRERVKMTWLAQGDPRARTAKIYWANRTKEREVTLVAGQMTEVVIDNLSEGAYVFDIYTHDDKENSSIKTEVTGITYGNVYEGYLLNRSVSAFSYVAGTKTATITFRNSIEESLRQTEILYTNDMGQEQLFIMDKTTGKAIISPYVGASFSFRAVYRPTEDAIDEFYSEYATYDTPTATL